MYCSETSNGPEWYRIRMSLQRPISSPVNVRVYLPAIDEISIQFADFVAHCNRTNTLSGDFLDELSRVFAECTILSFFFAKRQFSAN